MTDIKTLAENLVHDAELRQLLEEEYGISLNTDAINAVYKFKVFGAGKHEEKIGKNLC